MRQFDMNLYLKTLKSRYLKGDRKTKSMILDEFCRNTGYHRKHANRLFTRKLMGYSKPQPIGRKKTYEPKQILGSCDASAPRAGIPS